jgi:TPR repeat protein
LGKIFISYRREDAPGDARGVCDRLGRSFGEASVFMDVDKLLAGQRFDRELDKALSQCDVLIAVIGSRWMELLSGHASGGKRDFVRDEIAAALKRDIVVIPVMIGREANMPALPRTEDLPEDIRELVLYQKHNIAHETFGRDSAELIAAIKTVLRGKYGDRSRRPIAVAGAIGLVLAALLFGYWMDVIPGIGSSPGTVQSRSDADRAAKVAEASKKAAAEEAAKKAAAEEADRKAAEGAQRQADAEAARKKAAEDAKRKAEEDAAAIKAAAEEAAKQAAAEEAARKAAQEAQRQADAEAARKKAVEEAKRKADEDAAAIKAAEIQARKQVVEEAARRAAAEAQREVDAEAARKKVAAEEARRKAEADAAEAARRKAEADAAEAAGRKAETDAKAAADEAARKKAAEDAALKKAAEDEAAKKAEQQARLAAVTDCDRLAASPYDNDRPRDVAGVVVGRIDVPAATAACDDAMRRYPGISRFTYQAGRVALARRDHTRAVELFRASIAKGSVAALSGLGGLYYQGLGVEANYKEARTLFEKGATLGNINAMYDLGVFYESGRDGPKNFERARMWLEKAAAGGHEGAKARLSR